MTRSPYAGRPGDDDFAGRGEPWMVAYKESDFDRSRWNFALESWDLSSATPLEEENAEEKKT